MVLLGLVRWTSGKLDITVLLVPSSRDVYLRNINKTLAALSRCISASPKFVSLLANLVKLGWCASYLNELSSTSYADSGLVW